ncbi:PREDICTED: uncharacterized protein LOC105973844 [Erythranthe guttata]|uniref:uncharacterized protein LOC105973844 n=1 Tax=Erythranthe guttata TaxID=4155 RepID=UPI00064DE87C|nr:PREDICTED: uncharacterized protein LOC105973844 [Erythranthe guttata]|eukprot:XP_012854348.1 PREDICTED: uncharacterized protein LOC105973844 [Erythranthe guttata]
MKEMDIRHVKMWMNARKVPVASVKGAAVRTHGVGLTATVIEVNSTLRSRTPVSKGTTLTLVVVAVALGAGVAGYIFYKYRFRSYMDSEIMAIMSQYMPLDSNQNQSLIHHEHDDPLTTHTSSV